ncbi:small protein A (tmRNA-binding) [SAR116 cluster alpha proteobacterium HIMB100]|nr:small protein A (tmRNA-binding) [SAR116 cluster alpha proteobacterium HIMB100]
MSLIRFLMRPVIILFLAILLTACESTVTTHGRLVEQADLNKLELGKTTQAETLSILGKPSFEGAFQSGRLYYNNQKMEQKVAGETSTIDRQLIVLTFDQSNTLQLIEIRDKNTDQEIVKLDAKTPTPGDTLTLVDQIFTNLRRGSTAQ